MDRVGVGPRAIAVILDTLVFVVVACCFALVVTFAAGGEYEATGAAGFLLNTAFTVVYLGYFVVMEGSSGATLGKRVLKLRVVKVDGSALTMREALIRNVLRIIDGFFFYLVGAIIVWTSPDKQRLGDRVAGTIVVQATPVGQTQEPPYPTTPEQRF